jgi:pilus assembly protein CpaC
MGRHGLLRTAAVAALGAATLAFGVFVTAPGSAQQATPPQATPQPPAARNGALARAGTAIAIEAGSGRLVTLPRSAATVFATDPRIAEVRPASPSALFVFGLAAGRTTIAALDGTGQPVAQYEVTVRPSGFAPAEAGAAIRRAMPGSGVRIEATPAGLVLMGEVATPADAERAMAVARGFANGQTVENRLLILSQTQVNLRVRVAEVSREVTRQFGINWQALGGIGRFGISLQTNNTLADTANLPNFLGIGYRGAVNVDALIDALAQDRLITLLAEPNLTALSGETASFLVGGEFPIPIGQRDNSVTVEFKQFGISLAFVPTVLSQGRIVLRVRPEVSELTETGAVRLIAGNSSLTIPALTVRRAETTVELGSGQTFAIAGLLSDSSRQTGRAIPGVGEVPVLGALFRSDRFQRNETELVIVVTPFIVRPVSEQRGIQLPTDGLARPRDSDRILFFRQIARPSAGGGGITAPPLPGLAGFALE